MRGRVGSLLVQASLYGVQRGSHTSSTAASSFMVKSAVGFNMPARWLQSIAHMSTAAAQKTEDDSRDKDIITESSSKPTDISSYWGVVPKVQFKEDGTPWKWTCFTPHETYYPDVTIDLEKTHERKTMTDAIAFRTVKALRVCSDLFFQGIGTRSKGLKVNDINTGNPQRVPGFPQRYGCHAMMLETIAAVPGMVAGMLLHCKSLRRFETSGGWIKALLEEAENERMHLMTFMEVAKPKWYERALVFAAQGVWFNTYFLLYLASPKLAHRVTGYLEEEAVVSYTQYLEAIDAGRIDNGPAPAIAIDYWRLPKTATLRDVVMVVRADEAHHRDVNHFAADIHENGKELRESPAPVGYH